MSKELLVYTIMPRSYNASFAYRLQTPLTTAEDMGLGVIPIIDTMDPSVALDQRMAALYESDIALFYQPVGKALVDHMDQMKDMIPCKRGDSWKWPPSVVLDTDDNLFDVNPLNGAFKDLGIRLPNGDPLKEGDEVGILDAEGAKRALWKDGQGGFSVKANQDKLKLYQELLNRADAVTCSTPRTQEYVLREATPKRTFVTPNCIRLDHYDPVDLAPHPDEIRILWQGSPTHYEDWYPLRKAMGYLSRKYSQIKWVIWGVLYPWVHELIPADQFQHIKWCPYAEYKIRLCTIGHDINLCPLEPTKFNLCRSAIKFYESSILKHPAATVAQNTGPYADEIIDGETALLYNNPEEFIEKVSTLVENANERKRLAANAKDWVIQNRDAFKVTPKLVEFWRELREIKREEKPHPTEEEWAEISANMKKWEAEDAAKDAELKAQVEAEATAIVAETNGKGRKRKPKLKMVGT